MSHDPLLPVSRTESNAVVRNETGDDSGDYVEYIISKCGTKMPAWAYAKEAAQLFNEDNGRLSSIADYCAPAHIWARRAAFLVLAAQVGSFLMGGYRNTFGKDALGVIIGVVVACMDFYAVRFFILKWQTPGMGLSIPVLSLMVGKVKYFSWLGGSFCLTMFKTFCVLINAGNIGAIVFNPHKHLAQRILVAMGLAIVNLYMFFITLVRTWPAENRYRDKPAETKKKEGEDEKTLCEPGGPNVGVVHNSGEYCQVKDRYETKQKGKIILVVVDDKQNPPEEHKRFPERFHDDRFPLTLSITFGEQQEEPWWQPSDSKKPETRFDGWEQAFWGNQSFDRPLTSKGTRSPDEVRFSTWAHWWKWDKASWKITHFEALVDWSRTAELTCCQGVWPSLPRKMAIESVDQLVDPRCDGADTRLPMQAANRTKLITDRAAMLMFRVGVLKSGVNLAVQMYLFCQKCQEVANGGDATQLLHQQDIYNLLLLSGFAVLTVADIYLFTSEVYETVHMPLKAHAEKHPQAWKFLTYEAFFEIRTAYSHVQIWGGISVAAIFYMLGKLVFEEFGDSYTAPMCVESALENGFITKKIATILGLTASAIILSLLLYLIWDLLAQRVQMLWTSIDIRLPPAIQKRWSDSKKLCQKYWFDIKKRWTGGRGSQATTPFMVHLAELFERAVEATKATISEDDDGNPKAFASVLEKELMNSHMVREQLKGHYNFLGRDRPEGKPYLTIEDFTLWVLSTKNRAESAEVDAKREDESQQTTQFEYIDVDDQVFKLVDLDGDNHVQIDELTVLFQALARAMGKEPADQLGKQWSDSAFKLVDVPRDGAIDRKVFTTLMKRSRLEKLRKQAKKKLFSDVKRELEQHRASASA